MYYVTKEPYKNLAHFPDFMTVILFGLVITGTNFYVILIS